ncbi:hypothetical protein C5167_027942 [Papaver somniferum]|nr:hypothetical protein C5167_027942 [Papaver somniferum]
MESLTRRRTQLAIFLAFLFLFFISLNLSLTINSAPYDSHLRKLLARPPRTANRPPTPMSNPNKHFEVPPGPPPPQDDGTR